MGTAPQAIAGSAILRHMPRRMRRGRRRYSMRSGLIPPIGHARPQPGRGFGAHRSHINLCRGAWRRHRSAATRQSNARCPSQRSQPLIGHDGRGTLPSLSGAPKSHANCSESSRFVIVTASPHHFRHAARVSITPAPIIAQMFDRFVSCSKAQELHLHHVGTVMVFVVHAHRGHRQGCVRARTCLCPRRRGPLGASGGATGGVRPRPPAVRRRRARGWLPARWSAPECTAICALPISSCSSLSSMAIRPGAISSPMM